MPRTSIYERPKAMLRGLFCLLWLSRDITRKFLGPPSQPSWQGPGGKGTRQVFLCPPAGAEVAYRASFRSSGKRDTGQQEGSFKELLPGRLCPDIVYTDQ